MRHLFLALVVGAAGFPPGFSRASIRFISGWSIPRWRSWAKSSSIPPRRFGGLHLVLGVGVVGRYGLLALAAQVGHGDDSWQYAVFSSSQAAVAYRFSAKKHGRCVGGEDPDIPGHQIVGIGCLQIHEQVRGATTRRAFRAGRTTGGRCHKTCSGAHPIRCNRPIPVRRRPPFVDYHFTPGYAGVSPACAARCSCRRRWMKTQPPPTGVRMMSWAAWSRKRTRSSGRRPWRARARRRL